MRRGAWANIPPKRNRGDPICFSADLYRDRNRIEGFFQPDQTMPSCCDALRQAGCQLPCLRTASVNQAVATLLGVRALGCRSEMSASVQFDIDSRGDRIVRLRDCPLAGRVTRTSRRDDTHRAAWIPSTVATEREQGADIAACYT
jgi:hypothetical protein